MPPIKRMHKQLIDIDPLSGEQTWHHYDDATDTTIIQSIQDVSQFLEQSKRLKNDSDYSKNGIKKEMWHYATIPNVLISKFALEHGVDVFNKDHAHAVMRLLNTEYTALKNTTGKHKI